MDKFTIENLKSLCDDLDKVEITQHAFLRLRERGIFFYDIVNAIMNGEIIEQYPEDFPFPSCLVLGLSKKDTYLHTVCGIGNSKLWIITAYFPTIDKWEDDLKTRKVM